ncbi:SMP-30/gluconolactonase/LRE family protein [Chryseobacterium sp. 1B4]
MGSDGMTMDKHGNLYLTGNGVHVFNSSGKKIYHIPIPEDWTSNVTFGGKNNDILFITASKSVYTFPLRVRGIK